MTSSNADPPVGSAAALRGSDDRFRLLVESVVDYGIFMLDRNGFITSWNAGARRVKGYSADEILGKHFSIFYPKDEAASGKCDRELETALRDGRFEEEGWRIRNDGTRFWANVVIAPVRASDGTLLGFGKVTRDLTDRQRAQEELRQSEERMRLLVASVKDYAIFVLDPTGHVATWNPGAERLKGYSAGEIIGQHFSLFYPDDESRLAKCARELETATHEGRFEEEGFRIRKDGTRFWANVIITPIRNPDGRLLGFAKVTRALSERRRSEEERITLARVDEARRVAEQNERSLAAAAEELRYARDRAEEASRLKDDFLATVSHELRTPLTAILGWSRMLTSGSLTPEKSARALDIISKNATAQSQIIEDLLDVSRIITGQLRLDTDVVDISRVVSAAIEVVRPAADAKGVSLTWLPPFDIASLSGDASRLQQVLWNLFANAVKFTARGGRVDITAEREGESLQIVVADTGQGIAPAFLPRIFERFTQEDGGLTRRAGGLGLGLAIVKHLIELHGGTVEAQSEGEGKGSRFVVRLPVPQPPAKLSSPPPSSAPASAAFSISSQLAGLHVLVVDDEEDVRELVRAVLEGAGARVTSAVSAQDALAAVRDERPDLLLSDIGMPGEDGHALIRSLRKLPREMGGRIPAIALTAYARLEDRREALVAGFQNHVTKPIEPEDLVLILANAAGRFA